MKKYICIFCDERKDCGTAFKTVGKIGICQSCYSKLPTTPHSIPYPGVKNISYILAPFEYTGSVRKVILDFKFSNQWSYAKLICTLITDYLDSYDMWNTFDFIIPVPLHKGRFKERGYNQSELLCVHISEHLGIPLDTKSLIRSRATKRQSSLTAIERYANVKDAFRCDFNLTGKTVLLVDDICTTGNTLHSCANALKESGVKSISALSLAIQTEQKLPKIMY